VEEVSTTGRKGEVDGDKKVAWSQEKLSQTRLGLDPAVNVVLSA
jgi:hypothetical protein